jgi:NTE family protein
VKNARKALVLGGGGITGIAWELGVLAGLLDLRVDLSDADLVVGTSAGSVVGAQVRAGTGLDELYQEQLRSPVGEITARLGPVVSLRSAWAHLLPGGEQRARARIGRAAMAADTVPEAERRAVIAGRLPAHEWPARPLVVCAVEARTGEFVTFDRASGVDLVDAVAASCAVPMVWPAVTIGERRYVDGGVRSIANADLAAGHGRVVVLAPSTGSARRSGRISTQVAALGPKVHSAVVTPDDEARARMGGNALDPRFRAAAARAGRAQAARVRDQVGVVWGLPPT